MKKVISIVLCAVMLAFVLTSCSETQQTPTPSVTPSAAPTSGFLTSTTPKSSIPPSATPTMPDNSPSLPKGLEGKFFENSEMDFIMCGDDTSFRSIRLIDGDDGTYSVNVAVAYRNKYIKELFGISIGDCLTLAPNQMTEHMRIYFASPDKKYDIVGAYEYYDLGLAFGENEGNFIDYNSIPQQDMLINLDASYWDMNSYKALTVDGKSYWITGDISLERTENILVSYVNISLWEQYSEKIKEATGYSDIYELVKAGKWTYENAAKLGGIATYSLDSTLGNTWEIVMASQGLDIGFSLNTNELSTAAQRGKALFADNGILPNVILTDDSLTTPIDKFAEGSSLTLFATVGDGLEIMKKHGANTEYFMVPLPKYDENASYSTSVYGKSNVFGIPKGCESISAATATLEYMAFWGKDTVNAEAVGNSVPACYCDHGKKMTELAVYSVQNVKVITNTAVSFENHYEEKITDFINENMFKHNFAEILNDRSTDFNSYFTKLHTEVLHKPK